MRKVFQRGTAYACRQRYVTDSVPAITTQPMWPGVPHNTNKTQWGQGFTSDRLQRTDRKRHFAISAYAPHTTQFNHRLYFAHDFRWFVQK